MDDWTTWLPISWIDATSCSVALATVWTFADACSEAAATATDWALVSSAVTDIDWAVAFSSVAAEDRIPTRAEALASKPTVK
ncbi:MAG: hypothetical protein WDO24_18115 [Pseudomonadota bacterium]